MNKKEVHALTVIANNYIPKARIFVESLKRYHPDMIVHLMLIDKPINDPETENFFKLFDYIHLLEDLNDYINIKSWLFKYNVLEICTGVKPFIIKKIFDTFSNCEKILYFDPDIVIFSKLDDLIQELDSYSIILTPHQTNPEPEFELKYDSIKDNEIGSLRWGIFNLGFIGLRRDKNTLSFLEWWCERLDKFCFADTLQGLWVDQKWINLVPIFFEGVKIIKNPRFNVAPWNLTTRKLEGDIESVIKVNGEILGFYHFTGFDSGAHKIMAFKYAGDNMTVRKLINWYEEKLKKYNNEKYKGIEWYYNKLTTFSNNEPILKVHRIIYRNRIDLQKAYPDPYYVSDFSYYTWFKDRAKLECPEILAKELNQRIINWLLIKREIKNLLKNPFYFINLVNKLSSIMKQKGLKGIINKIIIKGEI